MTADINTLHKNAQADDERAKEELFSVLSSRFRLFVNLKVGNKNDAKEIVQDALMTIYEQYNKIDFHTSFAAWACKVLDYRIQSYYQRKKRQNQRLVSDKDTVDWQSNKTAAAPDLKRKLLSCFQKICKRNMRYARIVNLHYLGYTTTEICQRLNVKSATLYSILSKTRVMLDRCLKIGEID